MARTTTEIQTEIDSVTTALNNIRVAGQSWEITSGTGAGTKRVVTMVEYNKLVAHRDELYAELREAQGRSVRVMGLGW